MMKLSISMLFLLVFGLNSFGQVKIWDKNLKGKKTKGVICLLDLKESEENGIEKIAGLIPAYTVAGMLLPYAIKYGNYALKQSTSKKEEDYKSEHSSLNKVTLKFGGLGENTAVVSARLYYFDKDSTKKKQAAVYNFEFQKKNEFITINLIDQKEEFVPVKSKKKYDLIIETFEFSLQAISIITKNDSTKIRKLIDLGSSKIFRVLPSFTKSTKPIIYHGAVLIPNFTGSGDEILITDLIVSCKVNYLNPYGLTTSALNTFLEDNSDTNEEILNSIFIQTKEK